MSCREAGELDEVGGPAYIASLADGVPRSANVEHYAKIVKEKSTLRRLIQSANKMLAEAYDAEEDADILLDEAEQRDLRRSPRTGSAPGFVPLRDWSIPAIDTIEKLQQHKGLVTGVPSGFVDLDEMTSGFQPSDLVIVAARPSMGKTSFVLNIALHGGIEAGKTVGIFSLEMSKEQLFMRMLTSEARGGCAPVPRRVSRRAGLRPAGRGARHAARSQGLHRRHAVDRHPRDAREGAAAQGRARPRSAHHRLHPADAGPRPVREPAAGTGVDFAVAEEPGERARACRSWRCRQLSRAPGNARAITGRSSPTCASRAPSSRTPTS